MPCQNLPIIAILCALPTLDVIQAAEEATLVEARLAESVKCLASDALEGRGVGTKGLDLAADFIAERFAEYGLKTDAIEGTCFQKWVIPASTKIGPENRLVLIGPAPESSDEPLRIDLKLDDDFRPLSLSGNGDVALPLVFAGYGITTKDSVYDDYKDLDVSGKAVLLLRHEPQQADPKSIFNGKKASEHASYQRKIANASEHSAAAVLFVTGEHEIRKKIADRRKKWLAVFEGLCKEFAKCKETVDPGDQTIEEQRKKMDALVEKVEQASTKLLEAYDPVEPFRASGGGQPRDFPVVHSRRAVIDRMIQAATSTDLASIERQIDEGPSPHSRELTGWRVEGHIEVIREQAEVCNVIALLEGEGPLAEEAIVIGAHYDHVGWGGSGLLSADKPREVHNGADDNASGVAVMMEIARSLSRRPKKLHRSVVFIAFTAEERGLLGSGHYVKHPVVPLEKTIAMINLDMVGRLRENQLIVGGGGTAQQFNGQLDTLNARYELELLRKSVRFGPSDQASFYAKRIPALHFFTGMNENYHRPSDDFETLNIPGMRTVATIVTDLAAELANADERPTYVAIAPPKKRPKGARPYFGSIPDFAYQGKGYSLSGVSPGGPAERAGLKSGDIVIRFGESQIANLEDFDSALRKHAGGDRILVVILRDGKEATLNVTLDSPR